MTGRPDEVGPARRPPEEGLGEAPAEARLLTRALREAGGPSLQGVVLFGSRLVAASPDEHSAWDLVAIVDAYGPFHRHLVRTGHHRRPAWLLSALARVLPPNVTAFDPGGGAALAKCAIVSARDFARSLGPRARDHFLKGRMVQRVALVWARDPAAARSIEDALSEARGGVLGWTGPHLPETFTPAELARRMLEVSYGGELRPESEERVEQVFEAQSAWLTAVYGSVLDAAATAGEVVSLPAGRYRLASRPGRGRRLALAAYFLGSKARATLRWLKHVVTFNDWLTYIQRKVERRTGMRIEITPWERRLPLLLLWPKAVRVLRRRSAAEPEVPFRRGVDP